MRFIKRFYYNNQQWIGATSFIATVGVRQGCPLSPLLFALVTDVLLRKVTANMGPHDILRAFADDIGAVFRDLPKDAARIIETFKLFGEISGLELNLPKTIAIPLWGQAVIEAKGRVTQNSPDWEEIQFAGFGIYLGFATGPEKGEASWT